MKNYTEDISIFPIASKLKEISNTLIYSPSRFLILTAETAAGKSTILPLQFLEDFKGKILMTEPRRLAVLGVANRVADLLGEETGESVGYKIHLDKKISAKTRLEVVTEAILVRMLQSDPVLEDYNLVVLDEFHERSVNIDLALAFLKEAMMLRDDLFVVIMSATIDTEKIQKYLEENGEENSTPVPVMKIPGRQFPVSISYEDDITIEKVIEREINLAPVLENCCHKGNILVFLPGIREIRKVEENLRSDGVGAGNESKSEVSNVEICVLHSSISLNQQKKILRDGNNQRVILSSAIAETSLTVPGVTCVIDSGLARVNRMNIGSGMERLSTETESEFSATQRMGRAGRLMPGRCIRLWSQANPRIKFMPCEILRADLTSLVLECAERGIYSVDKIDWLDSPSEASWNGCVALLKMLGMIREDGHITKKGKACLSLGVHPRIASIAIGDFYGGRNLIVKYGGYDKSAPEVQRKFLDDLERRVKKISSFCERKEGNESEKDEFNSLSLRGTRLNKNGQSAGIIALMGYPDRLGKKISIAGVMPEVYKFPGGRDVVLADGKHGGEWIVSPDVLEGEKTTVAFDFETLNDEEVEKWLEDKKEIKENCIFENGKIKKTENVCYGKIILSSKRIDAGPKDLINAWINEVENKGIECLPLSDKTKSLLIRSEFLWQNNEKKENFKYYIGRNVKEWLSPFLGTSKSLTEKIVYDSLYWFLKGEEIDKKVPEIYFLPNGKKAKVKYERLASPEDRNILIIRPVIEIIIQRIFGCFETPKICGVKVLLRLLSPASRPLQITDDLEGFWTGAWPEICREMKGRYPKHNWDEKVCTEKD